MCGGWLAAAAGVTRDKQPTHLQTSGSRFLHATRARVGQSRLQWCAAAVARYSACVQGCLQHCCHGHLAEGGCTAANTRPSTSRGQLAAFMAAAARSVHRAGGSNAAEAQQANRGPKGAPVRPMPCPMPPAWRPWAVTKWMDRHGMVLLKHEMGVEIWVLGTCVNLRSIWSALHCCLP